MPAPALWRIKKAVLEFRRQLLKTQGDNILQITVFGSVAREEQREGSDSDVFVLLRENDRKKGRDEDRVSSVATQLNIEKSGSGIYISPLVCTKADYEAGRYKSLVFYDIADEGVVLYDAEG